MEPKSVEMIDWKELSKRGLIRKINEEILHPIGLAVCWNIETGVSPGALVSPDGEWVYTHKKDLM